MELRDGELLRTGRSSLEDFALQPTVGLRRLKEKERVTGQARKDLKATLKREYLEGTSIRELAAAVGRSYGFVHLLLTKAGAEFRNRGGNHRAKAAG